MKRNRAGYYLKEEFGSVFSHGFMSFVSVFVIVACLLIMGSFSLLALNVDNIIDSFEDENVVLAFVDETLSDQDARGLESKLAALEHVQSVQFISRDEAMKSFTGKYNDKTLFEDLDSTVLRHRYAVYMDDVANAAAVQQSLRAIPGIANVNANLDIAKSFITVRNIVSGVSIVLIVILFVVSLFIMSNTIKLATYERREEIAIMKMVGATNNFIRWPFILEGFILGILGAVIAYIAQWGIYSFVSSKIVGNSMVNLITVIPFSTVAIPLLIVFLVVSFGVAIIGGNMAIKNYLKV